MLVAYARSSREIFTQGKVEYTAFVVVNQDFFGCFLVECYATHGGAIIFISLHHFIAPALDLMPGLQARGNNKVINLAPE